MLIRFCLIVLCFTYLVSLSHAQGLKDPRFTPISQQALELKIRQTPLASSQHFLLMAQARSSHLSDSAYRLYTKIWQKTPNDPYANLLAGMAAENNWEYQTFSNQLKPYSPEARKILEDARKLLHNAVQMMPNSARANSEYGYFLWHDDNAADAGFPLLRKAASLAPKDPVANVSLGDAYLNPYIKYYNPALAEASIRKAITLDPLYAYPHLSLVFLYNDTKRYKEAQTQMEEYLSLTPPETAKDKVIQILQTSITNSLQKGQ